MKLSSASLCRVLSYGLSLPVIVCAGLVASQQPRLEAADRETGGRVNTVGAARPAGGTARPDMKVDPAVTPAGGRPCRECGPHGCRHGHAAARHHAACRNGACIPSCPVRPGTFGFYGTSWRQWPGQAVVPTAHQTPVTPVLPPRSEVPGPDEESFRSKAGELPEPPPEDQPLPPSRRTVPQKEAPEPLAPEPPDDAEEPQPRDPRPRQKPLRDGGEDAGETKKPAAQQPESRPAPKPRPQDEDLFDENAARVRRRFPVALGEGETPAATDAEGVVPATLERVPPASARPQGGTRRPTPRPVPRVAFDPRFEPRSGDR